MPEIREPRSGRRRPTLAFLGAAGTVTGSKFLIETDTDRVLVDCGLFQGERQWRRHNWDDPTFEPGSVRAVVLTHAHLDHCGHLPLLVKLGFRGRVVCTPATAELVAIVLRDAAHLQEEDARYANEAGFSRHAPALPLFDTADAEAAIALLHPVPHGEPTALADGVTLCLRRAGHILGSAFAEVDVQGTQVLFSGDLGRPGHPLLRPPESPHDADAVVVESTYGNRRHDAAADDLLADVVRRTAARGGSCLLPAFAVDRTPILLVSLARMKLEGRIPDLPVYVDSPMALRALEVYRQAVEAGDPQMWPELGARDLLEPARLHLASSRDESERLNDPKEPCIVVSASGMATGGRVLHHLEHQLPNRRNAVVLTGFQVPGTRGRALADGARQVKIHGRYVPVQAEVLSLQGYSAHADAAQVVDWLSTMRSPDTAYVVHGDPDAARALASLLGSKLGWNAITPHYLEKVRLLRRRVAS